MTAADVKIWLQLFRNVHDEHMRADVCKVHGCTRLCAERAEIIRMFDAMQAALSQAEERAHAAEARVAELREECLWAEAKLSRIGFLTQVADGSPPLHVIGGVQKILLDDRGVNNELERLTASHAKAMELLRDICSVEAQWVDEPRMDYVEAQINKTTWEEAKRLLSTHDSQHKEDGTRTPGEEPSSEASPLFDRECPQCGGQGWYEVTESAHDPRCDGSCNVGCPIPVQAQEQCAECGGSGRISTHDSQTKGGGAT